MPSSYSISFAYWINCVSVSELIIGVNSASHDYDVVSFIFDLPSGSVYCRLHCAYQHVCPYLRVYKSQCMAHQINWSETCVETVYRCESRCPLHSVQSKVDGKTNFFAGNAPSYHLTVWMLDRTDWTHLTRTTTNIQLVIWPMQMKSGLA